MSETLKTRLKVAYENHNHGLKCAKLYEERKFLWWMYWHYTGCAVIKISGFTEEFVQQVLLEDYRTLIERNKKIEPKIIEI